MNKYSQYLEDKIVHYPFVDKWTAVHLFIPACVAYLLHWFLTPIHVFVLVLSGALVWESIEWKLETDEEYGGKELRIINTISDVLVALIMVFFIIS